MRVSQSGVVLFDAKLKQDREYWIDRVAGAWERSDGWLDGERPRCFPPERETTSFHLSEAVCRGLDKLTGRSPFLTYTALVAAMSVCLQRYTGRDTVVLGSPALSDLERANALPIVTRPHGCMTFKQLLHDHRAALLDAYERQRYPINYLLRDLGLEAGDGCPLFDVSVALSGLHGALPPIDTVLDLRFERDGQGIVGHVEHVPGLLRRERAERLGDHLSHLLERALADPGRPVGDLGLLTLPERDTILEIWNATSAGYPADICLHELFEAQVERTPAAEAVVFEGETLTYAQLDAHANRLARHLAAVGVGPDVPVGIFLERSTDLIVALLGTLKAGGAYLPLDPDHPSARTARILAEARPPVVLTCGRLAASWAALLTEQDGPRVMHVDALPGAFGAKPPRRACTDNLAYVIHTSGSTGQPQGAMNTHRAICNRLLWMQDAFRLQPGERVLQKTPFSFDVSVWELFWPLIAGGSLVMALPGGHRDSSYLLQLAAEQEIRVMHFVPSMLRVFLEEEELDRLCSLRQVVCSGEALTPELRKRFLGRLHCALHNLYGPTEAAVDVTSRDCLAPLCSPTVPIGRPIANLRLYILDRDLQPLPQGIPGELLIGGVGLARGYLGRPELTSERFVPDAFSGESGKRLYRTGDLARHLPDGEIEFLGRIDHQVKIRGFRIELGEVEAALRGHSAVRDAVVAARENGRGETGLVAYVVSDRERSELVANLRSFLSEMLPEPMIPAFFVLLEALPLNPNGKVDRRALPEPGELGSDRSRPYMAPRTPVEEKIAELWTELLRVERVGVEDNFFELGGHSLLLTQLASRIRKIFHVDLPLRVLFDLTTIQDMAGAILAKQVETAATDEVAAMIRKLESLPPDEVEALLGSEEV